MQKQLAALDRMSMRDLKVVWRKYFDADPVRFQGDYMARRIAYRMQVEAYGGLKKTLRNRLQRLADEQVETPQQTVPRLSAGMRLMKEYRGEPIYVEVHEKDFEFRGRRYRSLTAIASEIVGCKMSGPRFFGLAET